MGSDDEAGREGAIGVERDLAASSLARSAAGMVASRSKSSWVWICERAEAEVGGGDERGRRRSAKTVWKRRLRRLKAREARARSRLSAGLARTAPVVSSSASMKESRPTRMVETDHAGFHSPG